MGASGSALMRLANLKDMDGGKRTTEVQQFNTHGDTWIQAVYNNEGSTVDRVLAMYYEWLKEEDDKIVEIGRAHV